MEEEPNELLLDVDELRICDERLTFILVLDERFTEEEEEEERKVDVPSRETRVRELLLTPALLEARRPAPDS